MRHKTASALVTLMVCATTVSAQTNPATMAARQWRQQHERTIVEEFSAFLSLPNVASDKAGISRNAAAIVEMLRKRGVVAQLLSVAGSNPVVFGQIPTPGATRTIVFYAHYDGQPLDPKEWTTPPFWPVLRTHSLEQGGQVTPLPPPGSAFDPDTRIYARSASDDKASIMALMAAVDAIRANGLRFHSNVKFVFEGEEEILSKNLEGILSANKALLSGDLWLICDGTQYPGNRPLITFGARGVAVADITVYGPRHELHSGNFGNWAPNPALALARLLASMKDDNGRVLVKGFYDGIEPLSATEQQALHDVPPIERELMRDLWLGSTEGAPATLNERLARPSLNVRAMASSRIGLLASNVIPATASASIDMRLVKGMDHQQTLLRLVDHVRQQDFFVVEAEPDAETLQSHSRVARITSPFSGYNAVRTPMDLPIAQEVIHAVESARGVVVKLPTMGGSLPLDAIVRTLGTLTINIHMTNPDNNIHSFNENLRLQNLWDGIEMMAALLQMGDR
jgi:acetylornithine deacetylase/succinyl-diaminopimelate desuccinylase-like protein